MITGLPPCETRRKLWDQCRKELRAYQEAVARLEVLISNPEFHSAKALASKQRQAVALARAEYEEHIAEHNCEY